MQDSAQTNVHQERTYTKNLDFQLERAYPQHLTFYLAFHLERAYPHQDRQSHITVPGRSIPFLPGTLIL